MSTDPLRLSDDYRESQSWERSDPVTGERFYVTPLDKEHMFNVRLGDGDPHTLTAYQDAGRWHTECTCKASCQDCAHALAFVRQYPQMCVSAVDRAHGPGGEQR